VFSTGFPNLLYVDLSAPGAMDTGPPSPERPPEVLSGAISGPGPCFGDRYGAADPEDVPVEAWWPLASSKTSRMKYIPREHELVACAIMGLELCQSGAGGKSTAPNTAA